MFRWIGVSITTFHGSASGHASSVAHDLMQLWLSRALDPDDSDLASAYDRLAIVFDSRPLWDAQMQVDAVKLILDFMQMDAARLPVATVTRYLKAAIDLRSQDETVLKLILESALSALHAESEEDDQREELTQVVADALSAMRNLGLPATLLAWVTLHRSGPAHAQLLKEDQESFMAKITSSKIRETHPGLLKQFQSIMAARYPDAS
jgi:hypothetical protein